MPRLVALCAALVASAFVGGCSHVDVILPAAPAAAARLSVENARVLASEDDSSMTVAYLTIVNPGDADLRLTSAECPDSGVVQLQELVMQAGKLVMQETKEGIAVPAGGHANLTEGGVHIKLMMLKRKLAVGDRVSLTLNISDGSQLRVVAPVEAFAAGADKRQVPAPTMTASS